MDRPVFGSTTEEILAVARAAYRTGDEVKLGHAVHELGQRDKPAAKQALIDIMALMGPQLAVVAAPATIIDADPPCLYAVELFGHPRGTGLYVGSSRWHTAACKFSLHTEKKCVCGKANAPKRQASKAVERYGVRLCEVRAVPECTRKPAIEAAEKRWAQELADQRNVAVRCDGRTYRPR